MSIIDRAKAAFSAFKGAPQKNGERSYRDVIAVGGQNDDWSLG